VALFDVHAEAFALLHDVAVEDAVVAEVVGVDRLFVGVCIEELVIVLVVLEPMDAVLGHAAVVNALDEREYLEPVAVEQHVARLLVVDFGDQFGLSLYEVVDVRVVDGDQAVPVLENRVLVDGFLAFLVLVFLGARVLADLLQGSVLDAEAKHEFVKGHFEAGRECNNLVVAVEVDHVVVDHVNTVFEDQVVDFVVGVVREGDFEVLEQVAVAAGDPTRRHDGDGGELVVRVVEQVLGERYAAVAVAHDDDAFVDAHLVLEDAVFGQDEQVEVGHLEVELVARVAGHVGREQFLLVHLVAFVVPLLQEQGEGALAQELELADVGRQLLHGLVHLLAHHGFLGVAHDLAQDVAALAFVDGVELELLEFANGVLVRGHVGDLGVDVEVRAVVALVHGVGEQDDAERDLFVEHGHQTTLLARDLLGLGADALELLLEVFGDQVAEFRLDALPEVVVVVELDLLDLDEVVEHLVAVDHLEAVREGVGRLLLDEREVAQQLVVLVLVRLCDHHLLLVRELLEGLFNEAVAQVVDVFVREEERDAEGVRRVVRDVAQVFVHVAHALELLAPLFDLPRLQGLLDDLRVLRRPFVFGLLLVLLDLALLFFLLIFFLTHFFAFFLGCLAFAVFEDLVEGLHLFFDHAEFVQHGVVVFELLCDGNQVVELDDFGLDGERGRLLVLGTHEEA